MGEPPRVVGDPNVVVSAAIAGGAPQRVVQLAAIGAIRLIACPRLVAELDDVLARDRFLRWRTREQLDRFAADIRALAQREPTLLRSRASLAIRTMTTWSRSPRRPNVLCSGDADLADVSDVAVLTSRQLLDRILGNQ